MIAKSQNQRIILGLKVRQLRQQKNITFKELKEQTGMSVSYLNEIERGKKYPKDDKIKLLADALGEEAAVLISSDLEGNLIPIGELLQSNFLNELPLDMFGIELMKVVEIIATAPAKIGAFISTLVELSRNHAVGEANFYQAAVRAYQELHFNYFDEIEEAAAQFVQTYHFPENEAISIELLEQTLKKAFKYRMVENGLDNYPELTGFRSVYIPKSKKLLLNKNITDTERRFQYAKELAFNYLKMSERAVTSSLVKVTSFDQVLNHFKAVYFASAILINKKSITKDLKSFFDRQTWNGEAFLDLRSKYHVSPEIMLARLTNILPKYLGLKKFFFIRVVTNPATDNFQIDKELHLNNSHHPHSNNQSEHYCRRWLSVALLNDLKEMQQRGKYVGTIVGAQRSTYYGTRDEYFSLTFARPGYGDGKKNSSVTIGLFLDDETREAIRFVDDPSIVSQTVNITCERCSISDCDVRVVPARVINRREKRKRIQESLKEILEK